MRIAFCRWGVITNVDGIILLPIRYGWRIQHASSAITDADLSYYDDILFAKSTTPEFKISIACDHLKPDVNGNEAQKFAYWWNENKSKLNDVKVRVFDKNNTLLAESDEDNIFDYVLKREQFEVEITCVPKISQILEDTAWDIDTSLQAQFSNSDTLRDRWWWYLRTIWYKNLPSNSLGYAYIDGQNVPLNRIVDHLVECSPNPDMSTGNYFFKHESSNQGLRVKDFIRELAKTLLYSIKYNPSTEKFDFHKTDLTLQTPIICIGHVVSISLNRKEQTTYGLFDKKLEMYYSNKKLMDIANTMKHKIEARLKVFDAKENHKIWGYRKDGTNMIATGDIIQIENEKYLVKEIVYEFQTLDTIRSFEAVCVKV